MNELRKVIILTTGGTIEKTYDEFDGSLHNRETILKRYVLDQMRLPYTKVDMHSILQKDSLDMVDSDREIILKAVANYEKFGLPIVIIHGTDTMSVSAEYCFENYSPKVPVVFTGAMKPVGFIDSDAVQNVTEAIFAGFLVDPGYYISFHGKLFNVPGVRKNRQIGTFEESSS